MDPWIKAERAFQRGYGEGRRSASAVVFDLLAGLDVPVWVVGGWAIDAFTGAGREHQDLDVAFFRRDVTALAGPS